MDNQRNVLLAVALSIAILITWELLVEKPRLEHERAVQEAAKQETGPPSGQNTQTSGTAVPAAAAPAVEAMTREQVVSHGQRIKIETPRIHGSIALQGGRIDDVELADYRVATDPGSPEIELLLPAGTQNPYFAEYGWVAAGGGVAVPDAGTLWRADRDRLTPDQPVTLSWDNGQGLTFTRTIAVDANYMFTVTQKVENHGAAAAALLPYALVSRSGTPKVLGYSILHEGPLGVLNGALQEVKYKDLKEKRSIEDATTGGWIGITDKYWLAAVIPDPAAGVKTRFSYTDAGGVDKYQVDFLGAAQTVSPGVNAESTSRLFAGAKEVRLLDAYKTNLNIDRFDLAVDFGWFYFLTKPIFYILNFFHGWLGNFGLAILLLTVLIKLLFFPLANKSYRAMSKMKALQPEMVKLRERFVDDKARLNQEMMELYKREKVNPAAGCLPVIVQIPVFFALYKVLFVTIEMRQAPFYGWIKDLSAPDPTTVFNLFGLIPWDPLQLPAIGAFLALGAWPLIMGVTMFLQQKINPPPPDPIQARIFAILPIVFTFLLARFPAGLVIYWAWNNALSITQQWVIMRRAAPPKT